MKTILIWLAIGIAFTLLSGWIFGISGLIMKIQKRISTMEGMVAFTEYVEAHNNIMTLSKTKLDDSIKLVVVNQGLYLSFWLKIKDGYNEKNELRKLYNAIKK